MKASSYYVSSFSLVIKLSVVGSPKFHDKLLKASLWQEFVPGFKITKPTTPSETWHIFESNELRYDFEQRKVWIDSKNINRLVIILEADFERLRQQKSIYTLHGAVIAKSHYAVALIGNISGIGKTSLASYATDRGWSWVADDKFSINGLTVIGGTAALLNDKKTKDAANHKAPQALWEPTPLRLICQPIVTNESELTVFSLDNAKAEWTLYDEMTRDIRQVNGIVTPSSPAISSLDNIELEKLRRSAVSKLVLSIPLVHMRGPKGLMINEIQSIINS